ncbi:Cytochrome P450 2K1 [Liparis tanakae]|uniref:Cytochrome P450 2K1 n=1 Tax=Liparis tanakae TaxID=230148 RepID=A0A4Z2HSV4_9TELE|nr:Cytochrome P450 2K1 [Liparis tanakae]
MRRFALSNLRDYGMGKKASEEKIIEEIQYLIKVFESHEGKPFNVTKSINYAVSNIISSIIYGSRFDYSDEEFTEMTQSATYWLNWTSFNPTLICPIPNSVNGSEGFKTARHLAQHGKWLTLNPEMRVRFQDKISRPKYCERLRMPVNQ